MDPNDKPRSVDANPLRPQPSVREHGENGYTDGPVGGFGEGYEYQVAHGGESRSPGMPSDSELDANPDPVVLGALEYAVRKSMSRAHIDAADLRVEANGTVIHLHGSVRHSFEKTELEARARAVPGVSSVVSELTVLHAAWQDSS